VTYTPKTNMWKTNFAEASRWDWPGRSFRSSQSMRNTVRMFRMP